MRGLVLLLILAGAFGGAAWWQHRHVSQLQAAHKELMAATGGDPLPGTEVLAPGEAVLLVGRPSGADPRPRPAPPSSPRAAPQAPPAQLPPSAESALGDYTHEVQPGQTLSGIAHLHYRRSEPSLLEALAAYNGLEHPDRLRAGQLLQLPPLSVLETAARR